MSLYWELYLEILDRVSITHEGWHTWVVERGAGTYDIGSSSEKTIIDDIVAHEVAQLRIEIRLLPSNLQHYVQEI